MKGSMEQQSAAIAQMQEEVNANAANDLVIKDPLEKGNDFGDWQWG